MLLAREGKYLFVDVLHRRKIIRIVPGESRAKTHHVLFSEGARSWGEDDLLGILLRDKILDGYGIVHIYPLRHRLIRCYSIFWRLSTVARIAVKVEQILGKH